MFSQRGANETRPDDRVDFAARSTLENLHGAQYSTQKVKSIATSFDVKKKT